MQLWGIEIGQSNLDPFSRISGSTDAEAVAIADVPNSAAEYGALTGREGGFAGISAGGRGEAGGREGGDDQDVAPVHAAFFSVPPSFFLASSARTYLSHFAMPARFSGM